ncbi:MAG: hypothetical protein MJY41_02335, partial [Bacteroidales bacterium]|nr:hypothetical protein [Bacteroidales bacterium]
TKAPELPATELVYGCYYEMFYGCSKLNDIKVAFTDWSEDIEATVDWVAGVGTEGTFECPENLAVQYGNSFIPAGWSVNSASPVGTKSFAATAASKSISASQRKPLAPKTLARPIEHKMITL